MRFEKEFEGKKASWGHEGQLVCSWSPEEDLLMNKLEGHQWKKAHFSTFLSDVFTFISISFALFAVVSYI